MQRPYTYKPLDETLWEMMALWWARTGIKPDAEPGSVLRTLFEATGFAVEDLTFRFDQGLETAIPLVVFEAFNFVPLSATRATASIRFTRAAALTTPLPIPAGLRVGRADGIDYEVTVESSIPANHTTATISVLCVVPGAIGNAPANTITFPRASLPTLTSVTNLQPAEGGQDEEPLDDQKLRFARYIASVHRATRDALEATALTIMTPLGERATEVLVLDRVGRPTLAAGFIEVWVDNGFGTPSASLLSAIQSGLTPAVAAGAVHTTHAVTPVAVNITFQIEGHPDDLEPTREAARRYIRGLRIGQRVSRENLITALTNAAVNSREITLTAPAADVAIGQTQRAVVGTLTGTMI